MTEKYKIDSVLTGKVTGIQPYGAFVALDDDTQGLVHISEIKHEFIKDINAHLKVGDEVKVKVISVDEEKGKISLSMKALEEPPKKKETTKPQKKEDKPTAGFNTLKDKLEEWIKKSEREDLIKNK